MTKDQRRTLLEHIVDLENECNRLQPGAAASQQQISNLKAKIRQVENYVTQMDETGSVQGTKQAGGGNK